MKTNEFGQVIGEAVPGFTPGGLPTVASIEGRYTRLEKLNESPYMPSMGLTLLRKCGRI